MFAAAIDELFARFGLAATWTPPAGEPVAVTVVAKRPDSETGFGRIEAVQPTMTVDVRVAELAAPVRGGVFVIDGQSFALQSAPRRPDANARVWRLDLVKS